MEVRRDVTGLDIASIERVLRELRDNLIPRDLVRAFNDASAALLKHFVMHMASAWRIDDESPISPVVVPVAYIVVNRISYPVTITAESVAAALYSYTMSLNDCRPRTMMVRYSHSPPFSGEVILAGVGISSIMDASTLPGTCTASCTSTDYFEKQGLQFIADKIFKGCDEETVVS
nr:hypothetical protein [Candidatus Sigynarchaeota archaeon]